MSKTDIEAVKAANPILDVLRDLGIPCQNNRIRCLRFENHAHGDRTPSVSIWPDRDQFKCWVCEDVKGDVIDLVRLAQGCSFRDALEYLARNGLGGAVPPPRRTQAAAAGSAPTPSHATAPVRDDDREQEDDVLRLRILEALLEACPPIGGKCAAYLQKRRIFRRTWESQRLRMIDDYGGLSGKLESAFGRAALERTGFFNAAGNLRFYRHRLLFPYYDHMGRAVYMQARAIEADAKPKELSLAGHMTLPYNCRLLDGEPGQIYLCEGVIDTLTLIEQGFPAVGVPGAASFKQAWAPLFRNKTVHVAFDPDAPGESGAAKAMERLRSMGIEARRLTPPTGKDLNDWFRSG